MSIYAAGRDLQKGETRRNLRRLLPVNRPKLRGCNDFLMSNSNVSNSDEAYVYSPLFFFFSLLCPKRLSLEAEHGWQQEQGLHMLCMMYELFAGRVAGTCI